MKKDNKKFSHEKLLNTVKIKVLHINTENKVHTEYDPLI